MNFYMYLCHRSEYEPLEGRILVLLEEIMTIKHLEQKLAGSININSFSLSLIFVPYHLTT